MKISIIGIGRLGLCLALCFEKAGYEVLGMDLRENYYQYSTFVVYGKKREN